jgi:hypothetical protein
VGTNGQDQRKFKKMEVKDEDTREVTLLNLKREFATKVGLFL